MGCNSRVLEVQAISGRWRSLTHGYLTEDSPHGSTESITKKIANLLWVTGSFQSSQHSFDFVKAKASNRLETISEFARRLESMFTADITSSDMYLLFESPHALFDETKMSRGIESDEHSPPRGQAKVAGTIEVGIGKTVCGREIEGPRIVVLLKPKVALENDLADS